jgi:hypothetical protein
MKQNQKMNNNTILIVSGLMAYKNSKINWPDLNYPNSGQTILRTIHDIDHANYKIQLDGPDGPWFTQKTFPKEIGFYKACN